MIWLDGTDSYPDMIIGFRFRKWATEDLVFGGIEWILENDY